MCFHGIIVNYVIDGPCKYWKLFTCLEREKILDKIQWYFIIRIPCYEGYLQVKILWFLFTQLCIASLFLNEQQMSDNDISMDIFIFTSSEVSSNHLSVPGFVWGLQGCQSCPPHLWLGVWCWLSKRNSCGRSTSRSCGWTSCPQLSLTSAQGSSQGWTANETGEQRIFFEVKIW